MVGLDKKLRKKNVFLRLAAFLSLFLSGAYFGAWSLALLKTNIFFILYFVVFVLFLIAFFIILRYFKRGKIKNG